MPQFKGKTAVACYHHTVSHHTLEFDSKLSVLENQVEVIMAIHRYTAIVEKEGDMYVALCPELGVASQGGSIEQATTNLKEAVELFLECADPEEIARRQHGEVYVTRFEAVHG